MWFAIFSLSQSLSSPIHSFYLTCVVPHKQLNLCYLLYKVKPKLFRKIHKTLDILAQANFPLSMPISYTLINRLIFLPTHHVPLYVLLHFQHVYLVSSAWNALSHSFPYISKHLKNSSNPSSFKTQPYQKVGKQTILYKWHNACKHWAQRLAYSKFSLNVFKQL